jgi:hypothetical protein
MRVQRTSTKGRREWRVRAATAFMTTAIGVIFTALPTFANVFESDDRRLITPDDHLAFVGVITCSDTLRIPTGSLITTRNADPNRRFEVLTTVAHAFFTKEGNRWQNCSFLLEGDPTRAMPITYVVTGTSSPGKGWNDDWAVAIVEGRVSQDITLPTPLSIDLGGIEERTKAGASILLAGHNGESIPMLMSDKCGPQHKRSGSHNFGDTRVFNHDCDMMSGWSGGPLLLRSATETHTIGVNSTRFNPVVHQTGFPFDDRFNPNTAIRVDEEFQAAIHRLAKDGAPIRLADGTAFCTVGTDALC